MVVDPYFLDDPEIGLDTANKAKSEFYILFTVLSAGKQSHQQARGLMYFLSLEPEGDTPFDKVKLMWKKGTIVRNIARAGLGTFNRFAPTFIQLASLDIDKLKGLPEERLDSLLRKIPNVSDKIINFIKLYTHGHETQEPPAILDRHILRAMKKQLLDMHEEGVKLPVEITGNKSLKSLANKIPKDSPGPRTYPFWARVWKEIMKVRGLTDLDVWRAKAMIGVDPMWRYRAISRTGVKDESPVFTDPDGRDIINLSIDRKGHTRGEKEVPGVKKDIFHTLDMDPVSMTFPSYTGERKPWTYGAGHYDSEGRLLRKNKDSYTYEDETPFSPESEEAIKYRERWLRKFGEYRKQGLYAGLEGKDLAKYQAYLRKLGLQDEV